jgi:hypothetical protein
VNLGLPGGLHLVSLIAQAVDRLAQAWQAYAPAALPAARELGVIV